VADGVPVSIDGGLRVFPDDRIRLAWRLADQVTFPSGVMALTFTPA
jgi:hypothetical protein